MGQRRAVSRKNVNGANTMDRLVKFARAEFRLHGSMGFSLDRVLRESGVARSSFYHHFGDRSSIIALCQVEELKESLRGDNEVLRLLVENSTSGTDLFSLLEMRIMMNGEQDQRTRRRQRMEMLVLAADNQPLRERLGDAQRKGTEFLVATLEIATDRGLIAPMVPLEEIAEVVQSMFMGRVFVDVLEGDEASETVNRGTVAALRALVRPQS